MRSKKSGIAIALILSLLLSLATAASAGNAKKIILYINNISMKIDGEERIVDTPPVLVNGKTAVPIRFIVEGFGGDIYWNEMENKATIKLNTKTIELWVDSTGALVDGQEKQLEMAPFFSNGRVMIPLRFISENLGYDVLWDDGSITLVPQSESSPDQPVQQKAGGQNSGSGTINQQINIQNNWGNITINQGDSPQVREEKIKRANGLILDILLQNIRNMDSRLQAVQAGFQPDSFKEELASVRRNVAPSLEQTAGAAYNRLLFQQKAASLCQIFNSCPLDTEVSGPLMSTLAESNAGTDLILAFFNQIGFVEYCNENLFDVLNELVTTAADDTGKAEYLRHKLEAEIRSLEINSNLAYLRGQRAINSFADIPLNKVNSALGTLVCLQPGKLIGTAEIDRRFGAYLDEYEKLIIQKIGLTEEIKALRDKSLAQYKEINRYLVISPTDTYNEVIGKAISLRQLGRIEESAAAFEKYGEMFSSTDPGAALYSRTAVRFTAAFRDLGLTDGAVYVFSVQPGSAAQKAGITEGSIIVACNGDPVKNGGELQAGIKNVNPTQKQIEFILLQSDKDGQFIRKTVTTPNTALGIDFMSI